MARQTTSLKPSKENLYTSYSVDISLVIPPGFTPCRIHV